MRKVHLLGASLIKLHSLMANGVLPQCIMAGGVRTFGPDRLIVSD